MKTPAPTPVLAHSAYEERPRGWRSYDESEFNGLALQCVERLPFERVVLHFGGGYAIEIRDASSINFVWPAEQ